MLKQRHLNQGESHHGNHTCLRRLPMEWSDKGVIKVTGIILKRFANAGVWEDYRQKRMNITGNVIISVDELQGCFTKLGTITMHFTKFMITAKIIFLAFCLLSFCAILNAADYQNFRYEDVAVLNGQNVYHSQFTVMQDGEYNLYVDANNISRENVELKIDGKKIPSLALPKVGGNTKTFRRLKLAAKVWLTKGKHEASIAVENPNAVLNARALLVERVTTPHRWQLVWADEFDDTADKTPDRAKWWMEEGFLRNYEEQYYTSHRVENAKVEDGVLTITAIREPWKNRFFNPKESKDWRYMRKEANFTSANINSTMAWQYGRIDVRFKITAGKGLWPAAWTLGEANGLGWPGQGEIDIMEHFAHQGARFANVLHIQDRKLNRHRQFGNDVTLLDGKLLDTFHVASVVWDEDRIAWYLNDVMTHEVLRDKDVGWDLENPQYFKANLAIGGTGGQEVDPKISRAEFVLDYVRVYQ